MSWLAVGAALLVLAIIIAKWHERFYDALVTGDEAKALRTLARRPGLARHSRALTTAAQMGSRRAVEELIRLGADVDAVSAHDVTPLGAAAAYPEIVALLLESGATSHDRGRALHHAALAGAVDSIRLLADAGAKIDAEDYIFKTPLLCAAVSGHRNAVALLLELGADPAILDEHGHLPRWKGPAIDADIKLEIEAMLRRAMER
jgi:ankyrin repeat protein